MSAETSTEAEELIKRINIFFPLKLRPKYVAMVTSLRDEIEGLKKQIRDERYNADFYTMPIGEYQALQSLLTRAADTLEAAQQIEGSRRFEYFIEELREAAKWFR
jgi:hypothetical protein